MRLQLIIAAVVLGVAGHLLPGSSGGAHSPVRIAHKVVSSSKTQVTITTYRLIATARQALESLDFPRFLEVLPGSTGSSDALGKEILRLGALRRNQPATLGAGQLITAAGLRGQLVLDALAQKIGRDRAEIDIRVPFSNRRGDFEFSAPVLNTRGKELLQVQPQVLTSSHNPGYTGVLEFEFTLRGEPLPTGMQVATTLTTTGKISIDAPLGQPHVATLGAIPIRRSMTFAIPVGTTAVVYAEARAAPTSARGELLERRAIYILADEEKLYTSDSSALDVELEKLRDGLREGKLSQSEYDNQADTFLRGPARESNDARPL